MMSGQMLHSQMMTMMGHQAFPIGPGPLLGHETQPPPPGPIMNPGMNDAPLEFNINKNKPPMPVTTCKLFCKLFFNVLKCLCFKIT